MPSRLLAAGRILLRLASEEVSALMLVIRVAASPPNICRVSSSRSSPCLSAPVPAWTLLLSRLWDSGHGGSIDVHRKPGAGATFVIHLPPAPPYSNRIPKLAMQPGVAPACVKRCIPRAGSRHQARVAVPRTALPEAPATWRRRVIGVEGQESVQPRRNSRRCQGSGRGSSWPTESTTPSAGDAAVARFADSADCIARKCHCTSNNRTRCRGANARH